MPVFSSRVPLFAGVLAAVVALAACASAPVAVADGLSPAELIQRAQDAYDRDQYDRAVVYYRAVIDRFPDDRASLCAADYEIAFIRYKQQRYEEASAAFRALLERYKTADAALLPAHYRILAEKTLAKIELRKK